jgi:hypothetical protein
MGDEWDRVRAHREHVLAAAEPFAGKRVREEAEVVVVVVSDELLQDRERDVYVSEPKRR